MTGVDALVLFSLITSEIFQVTHRYKCQFVGEIMTDMRSIKEIIQYATLRIPKGMKNSVSIFIAFSIDIWINNENITSQKHKTKTV